MAKLNYTPKALEDLQRVEHYITRQFGAETAKKSLRALALAIRQLEMFPEKGPYLEKLIDFPTDYRYLVAKPNYIIYRLEEGKIKIIRVLNERQDFLQILFGISSVSEEGEKYWSKAEDDELH